MDFQFIFAWIFSSSSHSNFPTGDAAALFAEHKPWLQFVYWNSETELMARARITKGFTL